MTLETGEKVLDRAWASAGSTDGGGYEPPAGFNWAFAKVIVEELEKLDSFMVGKKHYSESGINDEQKLADFESGFFSCCRSKAS